MANREKRLFCWNKNEGRKGAFFVLVQIKRAVLAVKKLPIP